MHWDGVHALILRARDGDEQAWEALHALVQPYLLRLARRTLGPAWPEQSVSDLLQGTWLRAWQGLEGFRGGADDDETGLLFRAWLGRTLRNVSSNDRRARVATRRKPPSGTVSLDANRPGDSTGNPGLDPPADGSTPSANLRAQERNSAIHEALTRFTDVKDREIVRLRFFEEMSLAQIAKRLQVSYDEVRERFHKSLRRLESSLKELA
jgi:RNA polymerase sigma factor (sigma-70 family)